MTKRICIISRTFTEKITRKKYGFLQIHTLYLFYMIIFRTLLTSILGSIAKRSHTKVNVFLKFFRT